MPLVLVPSRRGRRASTCSQHLLLELDSLRHGLHDQVQVVGQVVLTRHPGDALRPGVRRGRIGLSAALLLDPGPYRLAGSFHLVGAGFDDGHRASGGGQHGRDPGPHRAGSDDPTTGELGRGRWSLRHAVTLPAHLSRVTGWGGCDD